MDLYDSENCSSCLIKIVLVGDASVGKTNLVRRHVENEFETDFEPTIGKKLISNKFNEFQLTNLFLKILVYIG
jgi:GTPase SAR1 family protein